MASFDLNLLSTEHALPVGDGATQEILGSHSETVLCIRMMKKNLCSSIKWKEVGKEETEGIKEGVFKSTQARHGSTYL